MISERWLYAQMPFSSISGRQYRVDIYTNEEPDDCFTPYQLIASSNPFVTDESGEDNIYEPVRTQSGYLNILADGYPEFLLPPSNKKYQVRLKEISENSETLRWIGYLKSEAFTSNLFDGLTEIGFPVICPLSILEGYQIVDGIEDQDIISISEIIEKCIDACDFDFGTYYTTYPSDIFSEYLTCKINTMNWFSMNDEFQIGEAVSENNPVITPKSTMLETLKSICQFLGLSLRIVEGKLLFSAIDIAERITGGVIDSPVLSVQMSNLSFIGNSHKISIKPGYKKVSVVGLVNELDKLFSLNIDNIPHKNPSTYYPGNDFIWYLEKHKEGTFSYDLGTVKMSSSIAGAPAPYNVSILCRRDTFAINTSQPKTNFSWVSGIICYAPYVTPGVVVRNLPWITFESVVPFSLDGGKICLDLSFEISDGLTGAPSGGSTIYDPSTGKTNSIKFELSVGQKSWDGNVWQQGSSNFSVFIAEGNKLLNNKQLNDWQYNGVTGSLVPVTTPLYGKLKWKFQVPTFYWINPSDLVNGETFIRSVTCKMIYPKSGEKFYNSNIFSENITSGFTEELEIENSFTIFQYGKNKFGTGILIKSDGKYATDINGVHPEESLLERLVTQYSNISEHITIDVTNELDWLKLAYITDENKKYGIIGINHDFANDKKTLKLISIND